MGALALENACGAGLHSASNVVTVALRLNVVTSRPMWFLRVQCGYPLILQKVLNDTDYLRRWNVCPVTPDLTQFSVSREKLIRRGGVGALALENACGAGFFFASNVATVALRLNVVTSRPMWLLRVQCAYPLVS